MILSSQIALLFDNMRHDYRGIADTTYTLYIDEAYFDSCVVEVREILRGPGYPPEKGIRLRPEYLMGFPVKFVKGMGWNMMIEGKSTTDEWYGCDTGTSEVP